MQCASLEQSAKDGITPEAAATRQQKYRGLFGAKIVAAQNERRSFMRPRAKRQIGVIA
jgi:hypothetical protein